MTEPVTLLAIVLQVESEITRLEAWERLAQEKAERFDAGKARQLLLWRRLAKLLDDMLTFPDLLTEFVSKVSAIREAAARKANERRTDHVEVRRGNRGAGSAQGSDGKERGNPG